MDDQALIFGYVALLMSALAGIIIFYEQRRKRFEPAPSEDRIFRCEKCAYVYTDDPDVERSRCPQCGTLNEELKF